MTIARAFLADPVAAPLPEVAVALAPELTPERLGILLLRDGVVRPHDMVQALALVADGGGRLTDVLLARGMVGETTLYQILAAHWGVGLADLSHAPDVRLIDELGVQTCLRHSLLPWRRAGDATVIVCAYPEDFETRRPELTAVFGPLILAVAPARQIDAALQAARGAALVSLAESRVKAVESCRDFRAETLRAPIFLLGLLLMVLAVLTPVGLLIGLTVLAILCMLAFSVLKLAAWAAPATPPPTRPPPDAALPAVSVMVALYKEGNIAPRLVKRLGMLDYPRDLLDVVLVVEAGDHQTRAALATSDLPPWMRVVAVPAGQVKTKPRALNFALDHCRGSIVGVYDAEDAPPARPDPPDCGPFPVCAARSGLRSGHAGLLQPPHQLAGALLYHRICRVVPPVPAGA